MATVSIFTGWRYEPRGEEDARAGKEIGAPTGPRTDTVKLGISISRRNADRLKASKKGISRLIDLALDAWFDRES